MAFATYQANVLTHHLQLFVTIRNFTSFYAFTCTLAILFMWPMFILLSHFAATSRETLSFRMGEILLDQFFLQFSTIWLSTILIVGPIYIFKFFKMRLYFPEYYPLNQSTYLA